MEIVYPCSPDADVQSARGQNNSERRARRKDSTFWLDLLQDAHVAAEACHKPERTLTEAAENHERKVERANNLVHLGELSAARLVLVSDGLAPGTPETLQKLELGQDSHTKNWSKES